jgi:hypothetical protein
VEKNPKGFFEVVRAPPKSDDFSNQPSLMRRLILVGPSLGGTVDKERFVSSGVKGAAPLALPPPLGERGGHSHINHRGFATTYDPGFLQSKKNECPIPTL